jgi:lipopolysaccharide export system permease protein
MLGLLDRQMIYGYIKSYVVCLVSLMGLFIVVDLFTNLDDFTQQHHGLLDSLNHIWLYYANMTPRIFDRLCEAIVLLAGMFTVAMMQRNNELLPLLSAGISTRRVVFPVLLAACAMLGTTVANQELVLPNIDVFLVENRANPDGKKKVEVKSVYDVNGIHISAAADGGADKKTLTIEKFLCVIPPRLGHDSLATLQAETARYIPPEKDVPQTGGWLLNNTQPAEIEGWRRKDVLEPLREGRYFLYTDVDFQNAIRSKNWFVYMTTWQLLQEMNRPGNPQQAALAVVFHQRLTRPILGMTLIIMGLGVILRDQTRNVFISAGMCLVICAVFFGACLTCQYLGNNEHLSPALAAWLPVLAFGPMAFVMFDAVHT